MNIELFNSLKGETDRFIKILHDLYGYYLDSKEGFNHRKKEMKTLLKKSKQIYMPCSKDMPIIIANGSPDDLNALILHCASVKDIILRNSEEGENINKTRLYVIVMILEHWECDIRGKIASILELQDKDELRSDIMGDLNKIRNDNLHMRGKISKSYKNKIITFHEENRLIISEDKFFTIFEEIYKYLNALFIEKTGVKAYENNSLCPQIQRKHNSMKHQLIPASF